MIGNINRKFLPKTGMQEKQVLQDPGYVDTVDTCCMLHAACNKIRSHPNSFHCICRHCRYTYNRYTMYNLIQSIRIRAEFKLKPVIVQIKRYFKLMV